MKAPAQQVFSLYAPAQVTTALAVQEAEGGAVTAPKQGNRNLCAIKRLPACTCSSWLPSCPLTAEHAPPAQRGCPEPHGLPHGLPAL